MTTILIAHKADDKETAEKLRVKLRTPVTKKLEFKLLEENPQRGGWEKDLKAKIDETDHFLLWLPANKVSKEDWDWFIWSAAAVSWRLSGNNKFPIVVLHNKCLDLPSPLKKETNSFANEIDQIKDFLKHFYGDPEFTKDKQPLNPFLVEHESELDSKSEDILQLFEPRKLKVFVTHKSDDVKIIGEFIKLIKAKLDVNTSVSLEFSLAEDILKGEKWRNQIHKEVIDANILLFFMIRPTTDWNWCIYEAGLFSGRTGIKSNRRIIIFFNPDLHTLPSPLQDLQGVKVEQSDVERFLHQFFGTSELTGVQPPLNCSFADDLSAIQQAASHICELLLAKSN